MYRIMPKSSTTLTTTIVGEWIIDEKDRKDVDLEMRLFQCAVRTAFNRLLEGMEFGDVERAVALPRLVEKRVYSMFNINSRYAKDAVMQAMSIINSQKELVKQHKQEKERAIRGLRKKLGKLLDDRPALKLPLAESVDCFAKFTLERSEGLATLSLESIKQSDKREKINAKIDKLQEEIDTLKQHISERTIPKVIFGGRENFEKRRDGKLSKEQWKNLRNNKLYSRGDKSKEGGNLNTRIKIVDEGFSIPPFPKGGGGISMSVAISHLAKDSKNAPRITGKLWIDVRHQERLTEHLGDGGIYSIELIRSIDNKYKVHITFDEFIPIKICNFKSGSVGVDVNPDGIALTEIDNEGNLISSSFLALPELAYSRKNRRDNLIGETAKEIVNIALAKGKGLVIESLDFVKKNKGKRFNRISHNFVYRRLLESIERRSLRCGVMLCKVHPAYTSIIGKYKYATDYGLSFHQAAALVIARRGLGFRERIPKKIQRLIQSLISELNNLLSAMEAKGKREVKRLLNKLKNWRNLHSWSFWHTFNQSLRKVGVKPWLLRDINSVSKIPRIGANTRNFACALRSLGSNNA